MCHSLIGCLCVQRFLLYQMRNVIVQPFGETAQQVFARVSALREALTGTGVSLLLSASHLSTACGFL